MWRDRCLYAECGSRCTWKAQALPWPSQARKQKHAPLGTNKAIQELKAVQRNGLGWNKACGGFRTRRWQLALESTRPWKAETFHVGNGRPQNTTTNGSAVTANELFNCSRSGSSKHATRHHPRPRKENLQPISEDTFVMHKLWSETPSPDRT